MDPSESGDSLDQEARLQYTLPAIHHVLWQPLSLSTPASLTIKQRQ